MRTLNLHQENIFPLISGLSDGLISIVSFDSCWQKVELFLHFSHPDAVLPVSSHPSLFLLLLMFTLRTKCPVLFHSGHCVLKFTLKMLHKWHISTTNNGNVRIKWPPHPTPPRSHPLQPSPCLINKQRNMVIFICHKNTSSNSRGLWKTREPD